MGDIVSAFHNILSVCFAFSLPECGSHRHSDEGLLRKETAEHSSAFEASQARVTTQITTDLEQKSQNCEGCGHAVRLLSLVDRRCIAATQQHSGRGATARIQAEVAPRMGGAGAPARGQRRTLAIAKKIEDVEIKSVENNQSEEVTRNASFRQDPHRQNNHS